MRSPNHIEIKEACKKSISALMRKYELGEVKDIRVDTEGWVNPCFFVNDEYVFRFNARDPSLPKFQREKLIFDLLGQYNIPAPREVILDDSKNYSEYDILISKKLPGENIEADWKSLCEESKQKIAFEAGSLLKKIHSIPMGYFGELVNYGPFPQTEKWYDYLLAKLEFHIREAVAYSVFDSDILNLAHSKFKSFKDVMSAIKTPCLIHGDYHFGNLLHYKDQVSAVLDFEWSVAGDPMFDLARWLEKDEICKGSHEPFLKGYGRLNFSKEDYRRVEGYHLIKNIEISIVAKLHFNEAEALEYKDITISYIKAL